MADIPPRSWRFFDFASAVRVRHSNLALRLQKLRQENPDPGQFACAVEALRLELRDLQNQINGHIVQAVVPYVIQHILNRFDLEELDHLLPGKEG